MTTPTAMTPRRATANYLTAATNLITPVLTNLVMAGPRRLGHSRATNRVMAGLDPAILTRTELAKDAVPVSKVYGAAAALTSYRQTG